MKIYESEFLSFLIKIVTKTTPIVHYFTTRQYFYYSFTLIYGCITVHIVSSVILIIHCSHFVYKYFLPVPDPFGPKGKLFLSLNNSDALIVDESGLSKSPIVEVGFFNEECPP